MSYKAHYPGPSRYFDHVYDPNFITSGSKDVWRANSQALAQSAIMHIVPVFKTMFTDLPKRPRNYYVLQQNPLPHYSYYEGGDVPKADCNIKQYVQGFHRSKYFHAAIPKAKEITLGIDLKENIVEEAGEKFREIGCQTLYRESSAQTKPWMPNAIVGNRKCETPEVVYVADLINTDCYPGLAETEIVERARRRREWEKSLYEGTSIKYFDRKRTIIQAFEWENWIAREQEIQECQRLRFIVVQKLIKKRESEKKTNAEIKLENLQKRSEEDRSKKLLKIRSEYQRSLRKLEKKHKNISMKYQPVDIINEYIDRGSDLYAPQLRFGSHPRQKHFNVFKTELEPRMDNINKIELNKTQIEKIVNPKKKLWHPKEQTKEVERGFWNDAFLAQLYDSLKQFRAEAPDISRKTIPKCLTLIPKESSEVVVLDQIETIAFEEEYQHAVFLQKIIKGRAIQNILYRGRQKYRGLICELQSNHEFKAITDMYPDSSNELNQKRIGVLNEQIKHVIPKCGKLAQINSDLLEIPTEANSTYMFSIFDFLGKELLRLQAQRKAHALYILAEQERYRRESAEAGLRQTEELKRQENEQNYKEIITKTNDTITQYLENIIMDGTKNYAEEEARKNILEIATQIDKIANQSGDENSQEIVEDLVNQFMIPEIYKRVNRKENKSREQKHLLAAHDVLYGVVDNLPYVRKPITSGQFISQRILNDIIIETIPRISPLSSISSSESVGEHEANRVIEEILKKVIPPPEQNSIENIVNETIDKVVEHGENINYENQEFLRQIVYDINEQLLDTILYSNEENYDETQSIDSFDLI